MDSAPYYYYRRQRQKKEFLLPFLIIIFIAIIAILIIQLILTFTSSKEQSLDTKIKIFKYSGSSTISILPASQSTWINGYDGSLIVEGDSIKTANASRAILLLNDGNQIRMDENTELRIEQLDADDENGIEATFNVAYGSIWMNKTSTEGDYIFKTKNANIYPLGTIFAIEDKAFETLRVMGGTVQFDVIDEEEDQQLVLDSYVVGVGQQVSLSESVLTRIKERNSIDLIEAISNEWESSDWYTFNSKEDKNPTDYEARLSGSTDETDDNEEEDLTPEETPEGTEEETPNMEEPTEEQEPEEEVQQPLIVYVSQPNKSPITITTEQYMITGTIKGTASSVTVDSVNGNGRRDVYTLTKFKQGDTNWSYSASKTFNNLTEGTNKYTIYAKAPDGTLSEKVYIEIIVPAGTFVVEEEEPETTEPTTEEPSETEIPTDTPANLTMGISSFNGVPNNGNTYETTEERVEIIGTVSTSATRVYVNGFQLTLYEVGSGIWKYYAKTEFSNLNPGANTFTAYAVDAKGNKSATITFTVVKK